MFLKDVVALKEYHMFTAFAGGTQRDIYEFMQVIAPYNAVPLFSAKQIDIIARMYPTVHTVIHTTSRSLSAMIHGKFREYGITPNIIIHRIPYKESKGKLTFQDWKLYLHYGNDEMGIVLGEESVQVHIYTKNAIDRFIYSLIGLPILVSAPTTFLFDDLPFVPYDGPFYPPSVRKMIDLRDIERDPSGVRKAINLLNTISKNPFREDYVIIVPPSPIIIMYALKLYFPVIYKGYRIIDLEV